MAIIYLHGFASTGNSTKADTLREYFPDENVVSPDLPVDPEKVENCIDTLVHTLYAQGEHKIYFVGTSMGGFYSWYFSAKYNCPALLINPAVNAPTFMANAVGMHKNHGTGEVFEWKHEFLEKLAEMQSFAMVNFDPNILDVVVSLDDDIIDAATSIQMFDNVHQYENGGHRFEHFEELMPMVQARI